MIDLLATRLLSVRQPWTDGIVDGLKPVENRGAGFTKTYRGLLWTHAAKTWADGPLWQDERLLKAFPVARYVPTARNRGQAIRSTPARQKTVPEAFVSGAVVGAVDAVDAHLPEPGCCDTPWAEDHYMVDTDEGPKRVEPVTHLVLENPRRLAEPIHTRGALSLWRPDRWGPELVAELEAVLEEIL